MKKPTQRKPTRGKLLLLRQLCNLIPNHLVPQLAREHAVEEKSRTFRPWSHVVSLIYAQLTHALSLNGVCDALRLHAGPLSAIRGATPPGKNALSHANRERNPNMAEALFWTMLEQLQQLHPGFWRAAAPEVCLPLQAVDSRRGLDHHSTGRPVSGLGQAPPPPSRRQMSRPAQPANLPAALCPGGYGGGNMTTCGPTNSAPACRPGRW